ncbi:MAG: FecR domain-containing protein [Armatimonadota bacterium]
MLDWFRRKKKKPKTQDEVMADALSDLKRDQDKKHKRRSRRGGFSIRGWFDRRILYGILIIAVAVIADGVRRENQEFYAEVTGLNGPAAVYASETAGATSLRVGDRLQDNNIVRTAAGSRVVLEFPDQSVIVVGPESQMKVQLLEYHRGGAWRGRAFFLQFGQIWARVSPHFGTESEMRVHTPSSVAAVRGTVFHIHHYFDAEQSEISCREGAIAARGLYGSSRYLGANTHARVDEGEEMGAPQNMPQSVEASYGHNELWRQIIQPHWLPEAEKVICQTLDAPLTILGIGKASWAVGAADYARRTSALKALQLLHQQVEGVTQYPRHIHPATLKGLTLPDQYRKRLLLNFHCSSIELYQQLQGGRSFIIFARARDRNRTLYRVTPWGVEEATERELQMYRQ